MDITFDVEDINFVFEFEQLFQQWFQQIEQIEKIDIDTVSYIFCSDDYLLDINNEYLKHDYYTDVITFNYNEDDLLSGDVFISVDRVKENAVEYNVPFEIELARVVIHGLLHLVGYDDKTDDLRALMRDKENQYINLIENKILNHV